jgi:hypothetical protein
MLCLAYPTSTTMRPSENSNDEDVQARLSPDNDAQALQVFSPGQATHRNSTAGGANTPPVRENPPAYRTAIEHNIAREAATQRNTAMGSGILIARNQASDEGTTQTNTVSTCSMM